MNQDSQNNLKLKNTPIISSLINEKIATSDTTQISNQLENRKVSYLDFFLLKTENNLYKRAQVLRTQVIATRVQYSYINTKIEYNKDKIQILEANEDNLKKIDVGLISVSSEVSENLAPIIVNNGGIVIDDGSAFRMKEEVPLVVPEINEKDLDFHKGIISIPNCTTTPMVMAIDALNKICKVNKVIVSTYQAVSGTGKEAVNELKSKTDLIVQITPKIVYDNYTGISKSSIHKATENIFPYEENNLNDEDENHEK